MFQKNDGGKSVVAKKASCNQNVFLTTTIEGRTNQSHMENQLRRVSPRIGIKKGLSYNGMDAQSNIIERYTGVALNISQHGIQLETDRKIKAQNILLMFFDYHSTYIAAKGRLVYSKKVDSEKYKTGICLQGTRQENLIFIKKLIKSYHYRKCVPIFVS